MAKFELRNPAGERIKIEGEWVKLGRADDNNIIVRDPTVSRYHLNFYLRDGKLIVEDAGSQHGFLVNGATATGPTVLGIGDKLAFGNRVYQVFGVDSAGKPISGAPKSRPVNNNLFTPRPSSENKSGRVRVYGGAAVLLLLALAYAKNDDSRKPASVAAPKADTPPSTPLASDSYRGDAFRLKGVTEVQAEGKFRESLRDYYNGNYSLALLGFQEALTLNPSHEGATEFIQLSETRLKAQLDELLADSNRSFKLLQFHRAKSQGAEILTILSEQIPGYGRKIAQESLSPPGSEVRPEGQEETLLKIPCDRTREIKLCTSALELVQKSRQNLGEEDTLK